MKKFRLRVYYENELVARWMIEEKQKRIIEALIEENLFYEEVRFEFLEEEEHFKDLT